MKKNLTMERLKERLTYNKYTGVFTWNVKRTNNINAGDVAGCINARGYSQIYVDNISYLSHRLAWLYVYGYFPESEVDHINRKRDDNSIANLREVSRICNMRNRKLSSNNKSGVNGVYYSKKRDKWISQITLNNKTYCTGSSSSLCEATQFRWEAEKKHNFPNCNTTSTAYQYLLKRGVL